MAEGNGNGNGGRLEAVAENVTMRLVSRASMVVTPIVLAVLGWIMIEAWGAQKEFNVLVAERVRKVEDRLLTVEIERANERRVYHHTESPPRSVLPRGE